MSLDGKTPSEACGLKIEGDNKWLTLIQNAKKMSQVPEFNQLWRGIKPNELDNETTITIGLVINHVPNQNRINYVP
jgi:hypothetical protein